MNGLTRWLLFTAAFVALCIAFYLVFSWLGWESEHTRVGDPIIVRP